jgi:hypothetical protein
MRVRSVLPGLGAVRVGEVGLPVDGIAVGRGPGPRHRLHLRLHRRGGVQRHQSHVQYVRKRHEVGH